jgi:hypothetical protein
MYLTYKLALPYCMIFVCALKPALLRGSIPYFRSRYGALGQGYQALEREREREADSLRDRGLFNRGTPSGVPTIIKDKTGNCSRRCCRYGN